MSQIVFARTRLHDALDEVIKAMTEERIRRAYEHGYHAGLSDQQAKADRLVYRRGYFAGYAAGKRGNGCSPDQTAPGGRPRKETVG